MDRVETLRKRANTIAVRLYQSSASTSLVKSMGRSLGAVFLLKSAKGLPPINGTPADEWFLAQPKKDMNTLVRLLPDGYLSEFASEICKQVAHWTRSDMMDDIVSRWLARFVVLDGWHNLDKGMSLINMRRYLITALKNEAINVWKKEHSRPFEDIDDLTDDVDPVDPNAMRGLLEDVPMWKSPRVRRILEQQVHPDAPMFLDLLVDGYNMKEIVGDKATGRKSMLPHLQQKPMTYNNWWQNLNVKIIDVLKRISEEAA